ncbi:MAG: SRPBCC domain-containing protein, partial [Ginsengibacter sp.]
METRKSITIEANCKAPVEKVWNAWVTPGDIIQWNTASEDWHTTSAKNDLRVGGKFSSRMEARDGSVGFDFGGIYDEVKPNELLEYTMGDGRKAKIIFTANGNTTQIRETFEAESENSIE